MAIINPIGLNKSTGENSVFKAGDVTPVTTANVVRVNKNPAIGEYSSIVLALASITANSSSNLFLIDVGPGVYTESQIVMKPYVSLKGQDRTSCIIQPSNISQEFILGADESSVSDITARGAIGIGGHLFHYTSSGNGGFPGGGGGGAGGGITGGTGGRGGDGVILIISW